VVGHFTEAVGSVQAEPGPGPEFHDARVLKKAMCESIVTSPGSFLRTVADVEAMSAEYLNKEIDTSTWVVIQQLDNVVGLAVARWPDKVIDCDIDQRRTRFIESVWIAPKFRGSRMGGRLVNYLMEVEHKKYRRVSHFKLWVFEENKHAIRMYERMRFKYTGKHCLEDGRIELCYEYILPNVSIKRAVQRSHNVAARNGDRHRYGVTYRVLSPETL